MLIFCVKNIVIIYTQGKAKEPFLENYLFIFFLLTSIPEHLSFMRILFSLGIARNDSYNINASLLSESFNLFRKIKIKIYLGISQFSVIN